MLRHGRSFDAYAAQFSAASLLGADGVERVIEIDLNADERKQFDASVEHVRSLVQQIEI